MSKMLVSICLLVVAASLSNAFIFSRPAVVARKSTQLAAAAETTEFFKTAWKKCLPVVVAASLTSFPGVSLADMIISPWSKDVQYEVVKSAKKDAAKPKVGEMVAIRFTGSYKGNVFDDTFKTEQPYFYRTGVGLILKGLDDAVTNMAVGDRFKLSFGGDLAFGEKGRPSAPGKPRIPPNAVIDYEVELVDLPGQGEDMIADFE